MNSTDAAGNTSINNGASVGDPFNGLGVHSDAIAVLVIHRFDSSGHKLVGCSWHNQKGATGSLPLLRRGAISPTFAYITDRLKCRVLGLKTINEQQYVFVGPTDQMMRFTAMEADVFGLKMYTDWHAPESLSNSKDLVDAALSYPSVKVVDWIEIIGADETKLFEIRTVQETIFSYMGMLRRVGKHPSKSDIISMLEIKPGKRADSVEQIIVDFSHNGFSNYQFKNMSVDSKGNIGVRGASANLLGIEVESKIIEQLGA
jgi:hypothetical protein